MKNIYYLLLIFCFCVNYSHGQCSPDTTPPTITCPANVVAACPHAVPSLAPSVADNCGPITLQTYTLSGATTASSPNNGIHDASSENYLAGITTVSYYIEDSSGNSATCSFTVNVTDHTAPIVICRDDLVRSNDTDECTAIVDMFAIGVFPTAADACSGLSTVPSGIPPGAAFPVGTTTITWTVTDAAGNSTTCNQDVTVTDDEAPSITCPGDITMNTDSGQCSATINLDSAIGVDNCTITSISNDFNSGGADASGIYPLGTTIVTFTAMASDGLTASCSMEVTVENNQAPIISLLGANPMTLEACDSYTEFGATANDVCEGDLSTSIVIDDSSLDLTTAGTYNITYNVSNGDGNAAIEVIRTVHVVDTTAPSLTLTGPNPLTIGDCSLYTELGAVALDGCVGDISSNVVIDNSSVDTSTLGSYTISYSVTDDSGNPGTPITRTVIVADVTEPIITLLGDNPQTIEACTSYVELGATAIDPCFNTDYSSNIIVDTSALDLNSVGSYVITYNVEDVVNNMAIEVTRTIEVVDTTAPILTCPMDLSTNNDIGLCSAVVNYSAPVASDSCSTVTVTQTAGLASGSNFPIGSTTNTFEIIDAYGNTNSCSFEVLVIDNEAPSTSCVSDISQNTDSGSCGAQINYSTPTGSDNCSASVNVIQTQGLASGSVFPVGSTTNTFEFTDDEGNISSCSFIVTITDNEAPNFNCPLDITQDTDPGYCGAIVNFNFPNATDNCSATVSINQTAGLSSGSLFPLGITTNTFEFSDGNGNTSTCSFDVTINNTNVTANAGSDFTNTDCTNTSYTLSASPALGIATGLWSVSSGQISGFSFSDPTDPNSIFTGDIGETYVLTWSLDYPGSCTDSSDDVSITFIGCNALDFDGVDDNITFRDNYNFSGDFTIEIWVKPETLSANVQTIVSKRETNNQVDGYDLRVVNNVISFNWNNGQSISSTPYQLNTNVWHHVAVTFNNGQYTLFVDGIPLTTQNDVAPISNTVDCILGAMEETIATPTGQDLYFDGGLDEFRVWNVALTSTEIREMMNQEISPINSANVNDGNINGTIIPQAISDLSWTNLIGYYQMNQISDISLGNLNSNNSNGINGLLRFMTTFQPETAPIPYQSASDGPWNNSATWLFGSSQNIPNSVGIDGSTVIDWNIVRSSHNITSGNRDITLLGLEVNSNILEIANSDPIDGQAIYVNKYLKIEGVNSVLKLTGESQLLQDDNSIVDYSGTGKLHRDQQGTSNLYNYNYWGSPVGIANTNYLLSQTLYDGNTPVQWINVYNADPNTTPLSLSNRWLYLFENYPEDSYASWNPINQNHSIAAGLGFLMKGSGSSGAQQNYTFVGAPNNGLITSPITSGNQALVGNPYPSAIDSHEFINDNSSSIQGTLYFWEHYSENNTHILSEYQGGYAAYNLSGGNPSVSPPEISGNGTSSKIPERFVPVSQGFFVVSNGTTGSVIFENDQRVFVKESITGPADNGSVFMRTSDNSETESTEIKRVRIAFTTPEHAKKPLLLSFVPNGLATDDFDYGYDAINTELLPNDLNWKIEDNDFIIQGVSDFSIDKIYPLHLFLTNEGEIEIELVDLENFDEIIDVFIYDALLQTYHQLNSNNFQIFLSEGDYEERFYLTFTEDTTLNIPALESESTDVRFLNSTSEIYIESLNLQNIKAVTLINILGQEIKAWLPSKFIGIANSMRIPVEQLSQGPYTISIKMNTGDSINKKVIIKN